MQEYGGAVSNKTGDYRETGEGRGERPLTRQENYQSTQAYSLMQQKNYGNSSKDLPDANMATYCRVATGIYEATVSNQQYQNHRYNNSSAPSFSSPPHSPLVGLVYDPSSSNYSGPGMIGDRGVNNDRRSQTWSTNQEPIGTGAKKKIVKSQDKRSTYTADSRYQDHYRDNADNDRHRKDRNLVSESTSSLDFFVEGERMVSELCNISDVKTETSTHKQNPKPTVSEDDKNKPSPSSEVLLTALDKIVVHDQIPNQIVQLAIEACTDAENIAIAHHNRPCFKNIHSICAKTRSNVQKPDSAVANLHSQGIPWVIKNFIFSFVRILDGWKGVKELLSEKHDTFSRIENKYYSPNIRECFVQWQAVTKEMLTHMYKTFKCLDHGFTMEQKSFTHNYYATNSSAPRHQNQNKFQSTKSHVSTPRHVNASQQQFNAIQPPWMQSQVQSVSQSYNEAPWPSRSGVAYKKIPVVTPTNPQNYYSLNDQNDMDNLQKNQYKCDPSIARDPKPRQSWTITNVPDFRAVDGISNTDQRDAYRQLKHKMDAELGKAPGQPIIGNMPCDLLQRREMELKAKMIPLSYVEKSLIPSMASAADIRGCYVHKNNSCGDTKEDNDFFATWGQIVQKEHNEFVTHHTHNISAPSNVVTISNNISGPVQFIDTENDEFHEMSKVYMKPGSYKVPIKPADPISAFVQTTSQDLVYENPVTDEMSALKMKLSYPHVTLSSQPKYSMDSWPCLISRRTEDIFGEDQKMLPQPGMPCINMKVDLLSSMTSDRAWEAAKESAPKLMDFLHEDCKSEAARLYNALGLFTGNNYTEDLKQVKNDVDCEAWSNDLAPDYFTKNELLKSDDQSLLIDETKIKLETKLDDTEDQIDMGNSEEIKENHRCLSFDHTGTCIKDETQKSNGRSKITASGMWYHPKKKKPLPAAVVKKFDNILNNMSHLNEADFIQHDMDIKMAPRFYEVVKYPMCLNDISTKLKNCSYTDYEQVVQDFRRIFNNVLLYLKSYPDLIMKKNVTKISHDFEKMLTEEFQNKESKPKAAENGECQDNINKKGNKDIEHLKTENFNDETNKSIDVKLNGEDKII